MSERTYFNFRYALPGYIFITLIFLINLEYVILQIQLFYDIFPNAVAFLGIILGVISLLSGSAIGFVISQSWYFVYNRIIKRSGRILKRKSYIKLCSLIPSTNDVTDLVTIMAFILNSKFVDEKVNDYLNRIGDMYNTLRSAFFATLIGLILGYLLRRCIFQQGFYIYDWIIFIFSIIFMGFMWLNGTQVLNEVDSMSNLILVLNEPEIKTNVQSLNSVNKIP